MKIVKFARKPFVVEAVQVTEENMAEVAAWSGGEVKANKTPKNAYIKLEVYHAINKRQTQAFIGDWVLKMGKGFKVYLEPAMQKTFTPVDAEVQDRLSDAIHIEIDPVNN